MLMHMHRFLFAHSRDAVADAPVSKVGVYNTCFYSLIREMRSLTANYLYQTFAPSWVSIRSFARCGR